MRSAVSLASAAAADSDVDREVGAVIAELYPQLYRFARFRLERTAAEDATAAAMERMWRVRHQYRPTRGPLEPWLRTIGYNAIRDEVRRGFRRPAEVSIDDMEPVGGRDQTDLVTLAIDLRRGLARLAHDDAEIIGLRFGLGLSVEAAAELVHRTPGAVAVATHRALGRLRVEMMR
jgi:RNA polymerase sigma-70 factor (ECF subfamily)